MVHTVVRQHRGIVIVCGTALLIAAAGVVALRERLQPVPLPEVPVAQTPADVRVKAVERNPAAAPAALAAQTDFLI